MNPSTIEVSGVTDIKEKYDFVPIWKIDINQDPFSRNDYNCGCMMKNMNTL